MRSFEVTNLLLFMKKISNKLAWLCLRVSILTFLSSVQLYAYSDPTILYPYSDGAYFSPGSEVEIRVDANEGNSTAYCEIQMKINDAWVVDATFNPTGVEFDTQHSHGSFYYPLSSCSIAKEYKIIVYTKRNNNTSNDVTRTFITDILSVSVPTPVPTIQYRCYNDLWDPVDIYGAKAKIDLDQSSLSYGKYMSLVNYYRPGQANLVAQTNNGALFSPYSVSQYSPSQQKQGGLFQYKLPGTCDSKIPASYLLNPGSLAFIRIDPGLTAYSFQGFLTDPTNLPCSNYTKCNLRHVTYYPFPSFLDLGIGFDQIQEAKYYYIDPTNGQRIENAKMTSYSEVLGTMALPSKKVCFDHLKNSQGIPVTTNYEVDYTILVPYVNITNPQEPFIDEFPCLITVSFSINPVTIGGLSPQGQGVLDVLNKQIQILNNLLPTAPDALICDIIYSILPTEISEPTTEFYSDLDEFNRSSINKLYLNASSENQYPNIDRTLIWYLNGVQKTWDEIEQCKEEDIKLDLVLYVNGTKFKVLRHVEIGDNKKYIYSLDQLMGAEAIELRKHLTPEQRMNPLIQYSDLKQDRRINLGYDLPNELSLTLAVQLFPNPSHGSFQLNCSEPIEYLTITSLEGKEVNWQQINSEKGITIQMNDCLPGVYFLFIQDEKGNCMTKQIILN